MAMGACAVAGRAQLGDLLALGYLLPYPHQQCAVVSVEGLEAIAVVDDDTIAIATVPAGLDHGTAVSGHHRAALGAGPVHTSVETTAAVAIGRGENAAERLDEVTLGGCGGLLLGANHLHLILRLLNDLPALDGAFLFHAVDADHIGHHLSDAVLAFGDDLAFVFIQLFAVLDFAFIGDFLGVFHCGGLFHRQQRLAVLEGDLLAHMDAGRVDVGIEPLYLLQGHAVVFGDLAEGVPLLHRINLGAAFFAGQRQFDFIDGIHRAGGNSHLFNGHILNEFRLSVFVLTNLGREHPLLQQFQSGFAGVDADDLAVHRQHILGRDLFHLGKQSFFGLCFVQQPVRLHIAQRICQVGGKGIRMAQIAAGPFFHLVDDFFHILFAGHKAQGLTVQPHFHADAEIGGGEEHDGGGSQEGTGRHTAALFLPGGEEILGAGFFQAAQDAMALLSQVRGGAAEGLLQPFPHHDAGHTGQMEQAVCRLSGFASQGADQFLAVLGAGAIGADAAQTLQMGLAFDLLSADHAFERSHVLDLQEAGLLS